MTMPPLSAESDAQQSRHEQAAGRDQARGAQNYATRARAPASLAVIAGVATAIGLTVLGFDVVFVHGVACAVAVLMYHVAERRWWSQPSDEGGRRADFVALSWALAYLASLAVLVAIQKKAALGAVAALAAAGVAFVVVAWCSRVLSLFDANALANSWLGRPAVGRTIFAATIVALAISDIRPLQKLWSTIAVRASAPTFSRVPVWIQSAECFKKTGVILAACPDNTGFSPMENASAADDRGHGLLLSLLHGAFDLPATNTTLVYLNIAINIAGIGLLAWQIYRIGFRAGAAIFLLIALRLLGDPTITADVTGSVYGMFALGLLLPLQTLRMFSLERNGWPEWVWLCVSGLCLALVMLLREPFGFVGIITAGLAIVLGVLRRGRGARLGHLALGFAVVGAMVLTVNAANLLVSYRVHVQGVPLGTGILTHGLSHTLYLGLGAEPNSFGIEWSDTNADNAVRARDPTIQYVSPQYYQMLSKLYIELVLQHPLEVARIYAAKARKVLASTIIPWLVFSVGAALAGLALHRQRNAAAPYAVAVEDVLILTGAAVLLHAAQAILAFPALIYYQQAYVGLILAGALAADIWFRVLWHDGDATKQCAARGR
jgi:hypothetical protein